MARLRRSVKFNRMDPTSGKTGNSRARLAAVALGCLLALAGCGRQNLASQPPQAGDVAVATVDGLDVISGKVGAFGNRGYVLMPEASLEIDGFRQSSDEVAAFRFAKVRDSYAAQRGEARNVGVIGIAFFAERGDDWNGDDVRTRDTASPFPNEGRFAPPPR